MKAVLFILAVPFAIVAIAFGGIAAIIAGSFTFNWKVWE